MSKTVFDHLRTRLLDRAGVGPTPKVRDLATMRKTEWSSDFERLMRNRLLMGAFRYGSMSDPAKGQFDCLGSIIDRARLYQQTGNDELLVDIANIALVEYVHGRHPLKHFRSADDGIHAAPIDAG